MNEIPTDDIMEKYGVLSQEKQQAITNLLKSTSYLSICAQDKKGSEVTLDWRANQEMSIHLIMGAILTGRNEFGRLWAEHLKKKISQMA